MISNLSSSGSPKKAVFTNSGLGSVRLPGYFSYDAILGGPTTINNFFAFFPKHQKMTYAANALA